MSIESAVIFVAAYFSGMNPNLNAQ